MGNSIIGDRILSRRQELGLTLDDIATDIGVARSTIQRYEKGTIERLKMPVIEAIASVLHVNPAWLVGKTDDPTELDPSPEILALMKELAKDYQSGRTDTRDAMLKTHGVEHSTHMLRIVKDKHVFLYYHAFDDERSGRAASTLMSILEKLPPSDAEHLELLIEAYSAADARARQMVDLALDPFLSNDLKDWVGSLVPRGDQE